MEKMHLRAAELFGSMFAEIKRKQRAEANVCQRPHSYRFIVMLGVPIDDVCAETAREEPTRRACPSRGSVQDQGQRSAGSGSDSGAVQARAQHGGGQYHLSSSGGRDEQDSTLCGPAPHHGHTQAQQPRRHPGMGTLHMTNPT